MCAQSQPHDITVVLFVRQLIYADTFCKCVVVCCVCYCERKGKCVGLQGARNDVRIKCGAHFFCLCLFQPDGLVNQKTMTSIITPTKQSKHYTIKPCDGMTPDAMRARWRPDHFAHFRDVCVSLGGVAFPKITLCLEFCAFVKVVYFRPSSTSSFHSCCKCVYVCMCVHEFSCLVMQLRVAEVRYSHHDCCGGALGGWMFFV